MTHTPTPWHILREADGAIAIGNKLLPHVAVVRYSHNPALSKETGEANASHIVKCVNLHDELVGFASFVAAKYKHSDPDVSQAAQNILDKARGEA